MKIGWSIIYLEDGRSQFSICFSVPDYFCINSADLDEMLHTSVSNSDLHTAQSTHLPISPQNREQMLVKWL